MYGLSASKCSSEWPLKLAKEAAKKQVLTSATAAIRCATTKRRKPASNGNGSSLVSSSLQCTRYISKAFMIWQLDVPRPRPEICKKYFGSKRPPRLGYLSHPPIPNRVEEETFPRFLGSDYFLRECQAWWICYLSLVRWDVFAPHSWYVADSDIPFASLLKASLLFWRDFPIPQAYIDRIRSIQNTFLRFFQFSMDLLIIQCIVALQCTGKVNLLSYQVHSQNETIAHLIIRLSLLHEKSKDDPCGQGVRSNRFQWTPCLWFSLNSLAFAILATLYFMYISFSNLLPASA